MTEFVIDVITSADGFASKTDGSVDWFEASGDLESTNESQGEFLDSLDGIVIGRRTYEMFSQFWPYADPESVSGTATRQRARCSFSRRRQPSALLLEM